MLPPNPLDLILKMKSLRICADCKPADIWKAVAMENKTEKLTLLLDPANQPAFRQHERTWQTNRYVYPVVSRRSGGVSVGVNLNPDKVCNFDCIYCSVDRKLPGDSPEIYLSLLQMELADMLDRVTSGEIFSHPVFSGVTPPLRRLNDIAFSGDGEPTSCPSLSACVQIAADELARRHLSAVKIVLITNATLFHRPAVKSALELMDRNNGEIWAKLDAGTANYYRLIDRTTVPYDRILENIQTAAKARPIVIQTLFMSVHGAAPSTDENAAYIGRLNTILNSGGKLKLVQIYTVARDPAEHFASPLPLAELQAIAENIRASLPNLPVEVFP